MAKVEHDYAISTWDGESYGPGGFARKLDYDRPSGVYVRPPVSAMERSPKGTGRTDRSLLVDALHRIEHGAVVVTGFKGAPIPMASGKRVLCGVKKRKGGNWYVEFDCACGVRDVVNLTSWREAAHDAGCYECRAKFRKAKTNPLPDGGAERREARRAAALTVLPMVRR